MPGCLLSQYALWKGRSVPSCCVTSYCSGVSRERRSSSVGFLKSPIDVPLEVGAGVGSAYSTDPLNVMASTGRMILRNLRMSTLDVRTPVGVSTCDESLPRVHESLPPSGGR